MTGCGGEGKGGVRMNWVTGPDAAGTNLDTFVLCQLVIPFPKKPVGQER